MIYAIIGVSLLFVAIGFILTENNAEQLLSGYNTMSKEDREKFDLKGFIPYFKNFHVFLGISILILGLVLTYFVSENAGGVFITVYPILAYIYFAIASFKYSKEIKTKRGGGWFAMFILVAVLIAVVGTLAYGFKENKLLYDSEKIVLEGSYEELVLTNDQIKSIQLVEELPEITKKASGFELGTIKKGNFLTDTEEKIKLIINASNEQYILITKTNGQKIYYSAKEGSNKEILHELKKVLTTVNYKQ